MSGAFEPEQILALDLPSTLFRLQFWRPFSAACFLGKPSMSWATTLYLLIKYGCELEQEVGSSAYAKFLILQFFLLIGLGSMIGLPFFANSLVTAIIYAASRLHPMANIQFQFGIKLKYYMLPFGLMVIEMLQAQSVAAIIPHICGVLTAHFHHFFAVVWPQIQNDLNGGSSDRRRQVSSSLSPSLSALNKPGRKLFPSSVAQKEASSSSNTQLVELDDAEEEDDDDTLFDDTEFDDDDDLSDDDGLFDEDF
eukprot:CAMPEP_0197295484 /NCGR_PEP_ID=MMETSP0890-20130614/35650_1 /TAXON_ID=44058 ORGANISM="Aureoumbra lagunensis, Strain CCMP1510" /NCGR_SAMPLE_ID=MMETSP0890 /ASSEMBLY_ACC=CAM_ASM_000533 /LENGTH=251 /DNA_ID=CAMNT_0042771501 /DNA_START=236 /DNA_END=991 /DNA_ORIENTATION=-